MNSSCANWPRSTRPPYFVEFFQTKKFAEQEGISTQMAARALRYEWFERIRAQQGYAAVATAHHQRDTAETMLLNLTHGTGLAGLHGIRPKTGHLVRPLLAVSKPDLYDYVVENRLIWREDASNDSPVYQRNRLRLEVLPVLRDINPSLDHTMSVTAERVGAAEEIVRRYVEETAAQAQRHEPDATYLDIRLLQKTAATALVLHELLRPFGFSYLVTKDIVQSFGGRTGPPLRVADAPAGEGPRPAGDYPAQAPALRHPPTAGRAGSPENRRAAPAHRAAGNTRRLRGAQG